MASCNRVTPQHPVVRFTLVSDLDGYGPHRPRHFSYPSDYERSAMVWFRAMCRGDGLSFPYVILGDRDKMPNVMWAGAAAGRAWLVHTNWGGKVWYRPYRSKFFRSPFGS